MAVRAPGLPERIASSILAQQAGFRADLDDWTRRVQPGQPLERHNSQVTRLRDQLLGMLDASIGANGPDPAQATFAGLAGSIRAVQVVHLLWAFFRDKLAQRESTARSGCLLAADDLAWAAYEPFQIAFATQQQARTEQLVAPETLREPPLAFYSSDPSPIALPRTSVFFPKGLGPEDAARFGAMLQQLPVPLVGMPTPDASRLPPLVLLGHEVGHVVGDDMGLLDEAKRRLAGLAFDEARRTVWRRWLDEVLADVFGVLVSGSAYLDELSTALAGELSVVRTESLRTDGYPPRALRIAICAAALERLIGPAAMKQRTTVRAWEDAYGALTGTSLDYAGDVKPVVELLLGQYAGLGGRTLAEVLPWDADSEARVDAVAAQHLDHEVSKKAYSIRIWVAAAARGAASSPAAYRSKSCDAWITAEIARRRKSGPRAERSDALQAIVRPVRDLQPLDAARGQALADAWRSAGRDDDGDR